MRALAVAAVRGCTEHGLIKCALARGTGDHRLARTIWVNVLIVLGFRVIKSGVMVLLSVAAAAASAAANAALGRLMW